MKLVRKLTALRCGCSARHWQRADRATYHKGQQHTLAHHAVDC